MNRSQTRHVPAEAEADTPMTVCGYSFNITILISLCVFLRVPGWSVGRRGSTHVVLRYLARCYHHYATVRAFRLVKARDGKLRNR